MPAKGSGQELVSRNKKLRSGYTTGACAAAAAKAAALLLFRGEDKIADGTVEIPFPDGSRVCFTIHNSGLMVHDKSAWASVIKYSGDDPDVTNGAEISAMAEFGSTTETSECPVIIKGGKGVGTVTKPGLSVAVGFPAINPVPLGMIKDAVMEAIQKSECAGPAEFSPVEITISVTDGEDLAKKTLNHRLGIVGGISILGTTGIVRPLSAAAWTATIASSMDVARAMGHEEIVLSAGRTSEKAHMKKYRMADEAYVMMGDYLEFSFSEAREHGFKKIHLCAQWAKMLKIGMATPQTHVRHGAIDIKKAAALLAGIGFHVPQHLEFNTAREIFDSVKTESLSLFSGVCNAAKEYAEGITEGVPVVAHLVSYEGGIIASSR